MYAEKKPDRFRIEHFHLSAHMIQEHAAGALANLAADDKCSIEDAIAGGVHALVMLARNCKLKREESSSSAAPLKRSHSSPSSFFFAGFVFFFLQVPVGRATLGRIINVFGEVIDEKGELKTEHYFPIHREAPAFVEQATETYSSYWNQGVEY